VEVDLVVKSLIMRTDESLRIACIKIAYSSKDSLL